MLQEPLYAGPHGGNLVILAEAHRTEAHGQLGTCSAKITVLVLLMVQWSEYRLPGSNLLRC
jgi:hypothetical protein